MGGMAAQERLPATGLDDELPRPPGARVPDSNQPDSRKRPREDVEDDKLHKSKSSKEKREKKSKKEKKHKKEKREKREKHHKSHRRRYDSD